MAVQKVWVGSVGPLLYDDTDSISDEDGDLAGTNHGAISTTGQMHVGLPPSQPDNVIRQGDLSTGAFQNYTEATFTIPANGFTTAITVTGRYAKIGKLVTVTLDPFTGTSNATIFTMTNLPAVIAPLTTQFIVMVGIDNNIAKLIATRIGTSGGVTLYGQPNVNNSWTNTGTKGILGTVFSYLL
jgi:hypothetical protein